MANTVIQLKYSTVTATPSALNVAEPAYSYSSNTLFIGSPAGTGSIAIGGKFYLDQQASIYNLVNAAFSTANSAGSSTFAQAAFAQANAAFESANVSTGVNLTQNNSITAAFAKANTVGDTATSGFIQANAAYAKANTVGDIAAAAFIRANNSLNANTGGSVTGAVTITGDFSVTGNLIIAGNTITQNVTTLNIADPLIYLAANNYSSDLVDIGFAGNYYDGSTERHAGFVRIHGTDNFYMFTNYTPEPTNNLINVNDASFRKATLYANLVSDVATIGSVDIKQYATNAFNQANAAYTLANTNSSDITTLQNVNTTQNTNITTVQNSVTSAFIQANAAFDKANTDATNVNITSADYGNAAYVSSFKVAANGRIISANSTAIAIAAGAITSGVLGVDRGGTGVGTHTVNGVLLGQGTSAITTASSSTEGHILTINNSGVPSFSHLQGGTF